MRYSVHNQVTLHDGATATGNGASADMSGHSIFTAHIEGISGDTITFEGTIDDTNWIAVQAENLTDGAKATTATADGLYRIVGFGLRRIRARLTRVGGTVDVTARLTV